MANKTVNINVEYLTRVEGHGNIVVNVKEGKLETVKFAVVESPRFFEGMVRGHSIFEAQHITSRICGICACGHSLASIQAAETALELTPSKQTIDLRKVMLHMEIFDSHILHIYILAAPDLLGAKSFAQISGTHNEIVRRALRLKKRCNDVCDILVGRHIHPISSIVGGFTKLPKLKEINTMLDYLYEMQKDMDITVDFFAKLKFPDFERETEYVALVHDEDEYPLLYGDIGSTDGVRLNKKDYKKATNEYVETYSTAKKTKLSRDSYMTGALARININYNKLNEKAKEAAKALSLSIPCYKPYYNTVAQIVECVHTIEESIKILEMYKENGIDYEQQITVGLNENKEIPVKAGQGVGAVEVPRGLLFHDYEIDDNGTILNANCIIPTNQNTANIENDMIKLVPELLEDKSEDEIRLYLEMLVRAYDPCISCSAHYLEVDFVR